MTIQTAAEDDFIYTATPSNQDIISINNSTQEITALKAGTVTVTANHRASGLSKSFAVKVNGALEVYFGVHEVIIVIPANNYHTCIIIFAYEGSELWDNPDFDSNLEGGLDETRGARYCTIGATHAG